MEKTDYVAGKWYKYSNVNKHYFKISESTNYSSVKVSEDIFEGNYRNVKNIWSITTDTKLLTDLSEIQEFLPLDHPDKIKTSLVGRYIKALVDRPDGGGVKKNEIGLIIEEKESCPSSANFPSQQGYVISKCSYLDGGYYELMPIDYNPNIQTKEQVLEKAEKLYPIGTKFKSLESGTIYTVSDYSGTISNGWLSKDYVIVYVEGVVGRGEYLYKKGDWAEIVEDKEIIPEYVECIEANGRFTKGKIYKTLENTKKERIYLLSDDGENENKLGYPLNGSIWKFKFSTKEAYDLQEKSKIIPEYVECIKGDNTDYHNKVGIIYKIKNYDKTNQRLEVEGYRNIIRCINLDKPTKSNATDYKISTKEAYELQERNKIIPAKFGDYSLTPEECINTEIEVGDEVKIVQIKGFKDDSYIYLKHKIGSIHTVITPIEKYSENTEEKGIKINDESNYWYPIECFKLHKKKSKWSTVIYTLSDNPKTISVSYKTVDFSSPKVTNEITVPKINTISLDKLIHINIETNTKSITIPKLETKSSEIKNIKIQSFSLTI